MKYKKYQRIWCKKFAQQGIILDCSLFVDGIYYTIKDSEGIMRLKENEIEEYLYQDVSVSFQY